MGSKMKIEAVTVCMNYADFLAQSIPHNIRHFDKWIIVTTPNDTETQKLCSYYGIDFIKTEAARLNWGEFRKGECVTLGLNELDKDDWLLLIDADTVLQPNFRRSFDILNIDNELDKSCLYTLDRVRFESFEEWQEFISHPSYNLGNRARDGRFCLPGFVPTGFFQMWHSSTGVLQYVHQWIECGGEDIRFSYLWPRNKRVFVPETTCYHLASGPECNWLGRKSKPFEIDKKRGNYVSDSDDQAGLDRR